MTSEPTTAQRVAALVVGPAYLLVLTMFLAGLAKWSLGTALAVVAGGSVCMMGVLMILAVRASRDTSESIRVDLGSLLLCMVPLGIYLAVLAQIWRHIPTRELSIVGWVGIVTVQLAFMFVTTGVLLYLAEALVWLVRRRRSREK